MRGNKQGEPSMSRKPSVSSTGNTGAPAKGPSLLMRKGSGFNLADVKNRMK